MTKLNIGSGVVHKPGYVSVDKLVLLASPRHKEKGKGVTKDGVD